MRVIKDLDNLGCSFRLAGALLILGAGLFLADQQRDWTCRWGCGTTESTSAVIRRHEQSCNERERTAPPFPEER